MNRTAKYIAQAAVIAAIYAALTYAIQPIAKDLFQLRVSEALNVLPYFTAAAVPGLFIGCILANFLIGAALPDIVFGSLATLVAALLARLISAKALSKWLVPLPAVVVNAVVVGWLLTYVYKAFPPDWQYPLLWCSVWVGLGQFAACYCIGMPLLIMLEKHNIFKNSNI